MTRRSRCSDISSAGQTASARAEASVNALDVLTFQHPNRYVWFRALAIGFCTQRAVANESLLADLAGDDGCLIDSSRLGNLSWHELEVTVARDNNFNRAEIERAKHDNFFIAHLYVPRGLCRDAALSYQ